MSDALMDECVPLKLVAFVQAQFALNGIHSGEFLHVQIPKN